MSSLVRRRRWACLPVFSLLAAVACDVALNPQPLPPSPAAPGDGGGFTTTSDSGNSREDQPTADPNAVSDAAGGGHDGGLPPAPQLDAGDAGDAALDADAN